mmetsp:Transcript_21973/g.89271  ORF Transcript_21973/g.89271 Transcript_21973/m.89271 type:complete len:93 (-) Transcript_21973:1857-2135(-)
MGHDLDLGLRVGLIYSYLASQVAVDERYGPDVIVVLVAVYHINPLELLVSATSLFALVTTVLIGMLLSSRMRKVPSGASTTTSCDDILTISM